MRDRSVHLGWYLSCRGVKVTGSTVSPGTMRYLLHGYQLLTAGNCGGTCLCCSVFGFVFVFGGFVLVWEFFVFIYL